MKTIIKPARTYYIGSASEIKTLYGVLKTKKDYTSLVTNIPVFNANKTYGIEIMINDDYEPSYRLMSKKKINSLVAKI